MDSRKEHQILEARDTEIEGPVAGGHHAEKLTVSPGGSVVRRHPTDPNLTLVCFEQASKDPKKRGLACPVRAEQGVDLPRRHRQRHIREGLFPAEATRDSIHLDGRTEGSLLGGPAGSGEPCHAEILSYHSERKAWVLAR